MTKEELIQFEEEIKEVFLSGRIRAPVHLVGSNEEQLIKIFKEIKQEDWVFSTHRSHFHALLHGISPEWLKDEIIAGRSIHIFNKEHNFFSSAIVGGCLPIALGVAIALKMRGAKNRVWAFIGDMAAETGIFHEVTKYARRHDLPIAFIVEDNGKSINSNTQLLWGTEEGKAGIIVYKYSSVYPHQGCGQWVQF